MRRRRSRRRLVRSASALALLAAAPLFIWFTRLPSSPTPQVIPTDPPPLALNATEPTQNSLPSLDPHTLPTPPKFTSILVLDPPRGPQEPTAAAVIQEVSTSELLAMLREAGYDVGLVRVASRTIAVCNNCPAGQAWEQRLH